MDEAIGTVQFKFAVSDNDDRDGIAVPQVYFRDRVGSVVRPVKELKAFARAEIRAGTTLSFSFEVPRDMLAFTGYDGERVIEPGEFDILVGASVLISASQPREVAV